MRQERLGYLCLSKPPPVGFCTALCSSCWVGYNPPGTGRHLRTSLHHTRTSHSHSSHGLRKNHSTSLAICQCGKTCPLPVVQFTPHQGVKGSRVGEDVWKSLFIRPRENDSKNCKEARQQAQGTDEFCHSYQVMSF